MSDRYKELNQGIINTGGTISADQVAVGKNAQTTKNVYNSQSSAENHSSQELLLKWIYRKSKANFDKSVFIPEANTQLSLDTDQFWGIVQRMADSGLIKETRVPNYKLTIEGIDEAEKLIRAKTQTTTNINISNTKNSPIQLGLQSEMSQTVHIESFKHSEIQELKKLIEIFEKNFNELKLNKNEKNAFHAQIGTIKSQLEDDPDRGIIEISLRRLQNITEGAIAGLISQGVLSGDWSFINQVFLKFL